MGELVHVEHGHCTAGDLLRTAERITIERIKQRRRVERCRDPDRKPRPSCTWYKIGEQVFREREGLAFGELAYAAARQNLRRRAYIKDVAAFEIEIVRPRHFHADRTGTGPIAPNRQSNSVPLFRGELKRLRLSAFKLDCAIGDDGEIVVAGRTFDVVELKLHSTLVAGPQKTRQRRG